MKVIVVFSCMLATTHSILVDHSHVPAKVVQGYPAVYDHDLEEILKDQGAFNAKQVREKLIHKNPQDRREMLGRLYARTHPSKTAAVIFQK